MLRSGGFPMKVGQVPKSAEQKCPSTRQVRCSGQVKSGGRHREVRGWGSLVGPPDLWRLWEPRSEPRKAQEP